MQAIQLLKQEHGKAKAAFQEIETAPASGRSALWGKLRPELELHEQMEEKLPLRTRRARGPGRSGAGVLGDHPSSRGPGSGRPDQGDRPPRPGEGRVARRRQEASRGARAAHPQGGAGHLAEDRARMGSGAARGGRASDGGNEAAGDRARPLIRADSLDPVTTRPGDETSPRARSLCEPTHGRAPPCPPDAAAVGSSASV